tara:strand:- start:1511 stop:1690 length:180 start_codon:yes stop_codon:yes gene_type:complete
MAWYFANSGEHYDGETHELLGKIYSGKTRTPTSRRLEEGADPVAAPVVSSKLKPVKIKA